MENYGNIEKKTILLWTKLWYYTDNYEISIYKEQKKNKWKITKKKHYENLSYNVKKNLWEYTKIIDVS